MLDNTTPLKYDRGNRLPLYLWPAIDPRELSSDAAEQLVAELDKRGVELVCSWSSKDSSNLISRCLTVARAQKKLGQHVNIEATDLMNSFFNGDERTAHIDENGKPFFDDSFGPHKEEVRLVHEVYASAQLVDQSFPVFSRVKLTSSRYSISSTSLPSAQYLRNNPVK